MGESPIFSPTWPELCAWHRGDLESLYLSGLWHQALFQGRGTIRSPVPREWEPEDDDCLPLAHMLVAGTRPRWVPAVLPYIEVVVLAAAEERSYTERFSLNPQRASAGLDAFHRRILDRITRLPLPFVGRLVVTVRDQGSTRRLAQQVWNVEIGTSMPVWDPDVRALIEGYQRRERESRRREKETFVMLAEAQQAMNTMFGASSEVIQSSSVLGREAVLLRQTMERFDQAQSGAEMVKLLREALPMLVPLIQQAMSSGSDRNMAGGQPPSGAWSERPPHGGRSCSAPGESSSEEVWVPGDEQPWVEPGTEPHDDVEGDWEEDSGWEHQLDDEPDGSWDENYTDDGQVIFEEEDRARPPSPFGPLE